MVLPVYLHHDAHSSILCILQHPQLLSDICHLLSKVGTEETVELKGKYFLILNIFFFQKRSPGAPSGSLGKYRATKGMLKVSVLATEEISASFFLPACQTSNKTHLYHMRLMPRLKRKDPFFPKIPFQINFPAKLIIVNPAVSRPPERSSSHKAKRMGEK